MHVNEKHRFLTEPLKWRLAGDYCHDGIPLANGLLGALVWGSENVIKLTLNRADFWDHRGGMEWTEKATYTNMLRWIREGDAASLHRTFEGGPGIKRPTMLPLGRVELRFPDGYQVKHAALDLASGEARIEMEGISNSYRLKLCVLMEEPVLAVSIQSKETDVLNYPELKAIPSYEGSTVVSKYFQFNAIPAPESFNDGELKGWTQELPEDEPICVACSDYPAAGDTNVLIGVFRGNSPDNAMDTAKTIINKLTASAKHDGVSDYQEATTGTMLWWRSFWEKTAAVHTPDEDLQLLYYLGIYKLGCVSVPGRPAATLQGPWIEDHRLPPYSNDYHFNVNVQEIHWPAFASNHLETLEPLWDLLQSWWPQMKQMARRFAGVEDGLQLPHAVDDRCVAMGGIWSIDHASTAWMAQLAWLYWKYSGDKSFLRETAYPLMKGAMRVYEAMLEDDGDSLCLPLNFSSEFGYSFFEATGKNPSYQLAMIHFLGRALLEVSGQPGLTATEKDRERWEEIIARVPVVSASSERKQTNPWALIGPYGFVAQLEKNEEKRLSPAELRELNPPPCWMGKEIDPGAIGGAGEILLWEGQPLNRSHRHHSHLAGIYPLDVLDFYPGGKHCSLVCNSIRNHALQGMGQWSGWCIPWASIIHARLRNGGMAALLLHILRRCFMRAGYATTHDPVFWGFADSNQRNFMQLDAALAAAAAVLEMLAHGAQGAIRIFPAVPDEWQSASFSGIRCEGGLLVSSNMENGKATRVELIAERAGCHRLENPFKGRDALACYAHGKAVKFGGDLEFIDLSVAAGDKIEIKLSPLREGKGGRQ